MTQAGCFLWTTLLFLLLSGGGIFAEVSRGAGWLGMAAGLAGWVALLLGYQLLLAAVDSWRRKRFPDRVPDPWWLVAVVCLCCAASAVATVLLYRRAFR